MSIKTVKMISCLEGGDIHCSISPRSFLEKDVPEQVLMRIFGTDEVIVNYKLKTNKQFSPYQFGAIVLKKMMNGRRFGRQNLKELD